jgi:hypothetical protein
LADIAEGNMACVVGVEEVIDIVDIHNLALAEEGRASSHDRMAQECCDQTYDAHH